mmetsp:Transcript_59500/g.158285  ORF Transcript_59500/g.158285 Transcript_59500/m.158285 type:complete len:224 (+) Transcript_59500:225-896(+)
MFKPCISHGNDVLPALVRVPGVKTRHCVPHRLNLRRGEDPLESLRVLRHRVRHADALKRINHSNLFQDFPQARHVSVAHGLNPRALRIRNYNHLSQHRGQRQQIHHLMSKRFKLVGSVCVLTWQRVVQLMKPCGRAESVVPVENDYRLRLVSEHGLAVQACSSDVGARILQSCLFGPSPPTSVKAAATTKIKNEPQAARLDVCQRSLRTEVGRVGSTAQVFCN